jgi:hypothetical protein
MTKRRQPKVQHNFPVPKSAPPPLTLAEARALANGLVLELADVVGDSAGVNAVMRRWLDDLDLRHFSQTCMVAVKLVFDECLTPPPPGFDAPADALVLVPPKEPA